jgi:hypothetical protein
MKAMNTIAKQVIGGFEIRLVERRHCDLPECGPSSYAILVHYLLIPNGITGMDCIKARTEKSALQEFERQIEFARQRVAEGFRYAG